MKEASAFVVIATPVRVHATGATQHLASHSAGRHDGVNQRNELYGVEIVGSSQDCCDRRSAGVGGNVMFGSLSRSIGGVRASFPPALTARIDEELTTTPEKSILSAARSFAGRTACSQFHTPACCQSCSLRQQLTAEPHPISDGKSRQRMSAFSNNRMLVRVARSATGLRPRYLKRGDLGRGRSGSISAHSSPSIISLPSLWPVCHDSQG